ncbi:MAG: AAA family ATPase [Nitrosomonadales bacterium]|nr:AAA family ATPase [Nitrosomonadales bacterium]
MSIQRQDTDQQRLIAALKDPGCYPHAAKDIEVIETHISWVVLAGDYAYKIKKALDLGFLDYSTLAARRFCCDEELRLNRRTAPDIYLETVNIGGTPAQPRLGAQPAIEYAVRMRRFASAELMDRLLPRGKIAAQHIDRLAATIARFHAGVPVANAASAFGTPATIEAAAMQNYRQLRASLPGRAERESIARLEAATAAEFAACASLFAQRRAQGFVRECHGDLHLGNIVLAGDVPVPFDCIEFNPALRWIDVMDEVAFSVMDLLHRDRADFAWRLLNAYLEASGDYGGLAVLRFYLAYRAAVRAKVCAIRAAQSSIPKRERSGELAACRSYLVLAQQCLQQYAPALIVTHGLPGSGKTTFSQMALQQLGAVRIRSDVERKRMYGLGMLESSAAVGDIYGREATRRTYARLRELAQELLTAGCTVIVDAAFLKRAERESFRALAQNLAVPFVIASLYAQDETLRERVRQRRNDASEADVAVLEKLQAAQEVLAPAELEASARFTTAEAPTSKANMQAWQRLTRLLEHAAQGGWHTA